MSVQRTFKIIIILLYCQPVFSELDRKIDYAFFKDTTVWPSLNIKVCWERQTSPEFNNTKANRELVKKAVEETWEKESLVRFVGWGWCPNGSFYGLRISMTREKTMTYSLGTQLLKSHPVHHKKGMYLNFKMDYPVLGFDGKKTDYERCVENGIERSDKGRNQCLKFIAFHEFGHVLGLSHEQNRPEDGRNRFVPIAIPLCSTEDSASDNVHGNTFFTDFDPDSIMNYCRQKYFGDSTLSKMDKFAIKVYYGNIPEFIANTGYFGYSKG